MRKLFTMLLLAVLVATPLVAFAEDVTVVADIGPPALVIHANYELLSVTATGFEYSGATVIELNEPAMRSAGMLEVMPTGFTKSCGSEDLLLRTADNLRSTLLHEH